MSPKISDDMRETVKGFLASAELSPTEPIPYDTVRSMLEQFGEQLAGDMAILARFFAKMEFSDAALMALMGNFREFRKQLDEAPAPRPKVV